jgi:hypothetical protein
MQKIALVMWSRMLIAAAALGGFSCAATGEEISKYVADRFLQNPLITPSMMGGAGDNINGPSVIKAPDWLKNKLGKYYMYFAHHEGEYIRLAYANDLAGPWTIYKAGVIHAKDTGWNPDHVASPDVMVDNDRQEIRVYFHSPVTPVPKSTDPQYREKLTHARQDSFLAVSKDGLDFKIHRESLGPSYFRVWQWGGYYYALPRLGTPLFRSKDGFAPFERASHGPFDDDPAFKNIRHVAVLPEGNKLTVFFTRIGDAPERIFVTEIEMTSDWQSWHATPPKLVLKPETGYEGVALPVVPSQRGSSTEPENGLRDPAVFSEGGHLYLFYTVEAERGIAAAELRMVSPGVK